MVDAETGERLSIGDAIAEGSVTESETPFSFGNSQSKGAHGSAVRKKKSSLAKFANKHVHARDDILMPKGTADSIDPVNGSVTGSHSSSAGGSGSIDERTDKQKTAANAADSDRVAEEVATGLTNMVASASRKKRSVLGKLAEKQHSSVGDSTGSLRSPSISGESNIHNSATSDVMMAEPLLTSASERPVPKNRVDVKSKASRDHSDDVRTDSLAASGVYDQAPPADRDSDDEDMSQVVQKLEELSEDTPQSKPSPGEIKMSSSLPNVAVGASGPQEKSQWTNIRRRVGSATLGHAESGSMSSLSYASAPLSATARSARRRNFLVGGISADGGLMGAHELERLFPNRTLTMFVGTWNAAESKTVPANLNDFFLPEVVENLPDIYVITVQENSFDKWEWSVKLQETLGPSHVLFCAQEHGSLLIDVFVKRELIWHLSVAESATVTTRAFKQWKTKGAVAVSFTLFGTSFLFIGSHLKAHHGRLKERLQDCEAISKGLNLPRQVIHEKYLRHSDVTTRFDAVFWFGDLNFRLSRTREQVFQLIDGAKDSAAEASIYEALLKHDELLVERNSGAVFHDFQEGRITFPPSFKYDIDSDVYDSSAKQRVPAYTDRVLFRSKKKNGIVCCHYGMVNTLRHSDHRPVYAICRVSLRPGRDSIPLSAGHFNREVFLEAARRRSLHKLITKLGKGNSPSSICSVM